MIAEFRNKEFGIIEIIARGWKAFKDNFISILIITLIINLPFDIIDAFLSNENNQFDRTTYLRITLLILTLQLPGIMGVAVIVEQYILQEHTTATEKAFSALKKAFSRFGAMFGTGTLLSGLTLVLFLLFLIPGFIFLVNQYFSLEAVTLREQSGQAALSYSKSIVQGRWWKVFFLWVASLINLYIIAFILTFVTYLVVSISPSLNLFTAIIFNFSMSLLGQLNQVFSTICFLNLDQRKN